MCPSQVRQTQGCPRAQDFGSLGNDSIRVRDMLEYPIGVDPIDGSLRQAEVMDIALFDLRLGVVRRSRDGDSDGGGVVVDAQDPARRADGLRAPRPVSNGAEGRDPRQCYPAGATRSLRRIGAASDLYGAR